MPGPLRAFRDIRLVLCVAAVLLVVTAATALSRPQDIVGDVFAKGTRYAATTYRDHMNYFLDAVAPRLSVDIPISDRTPLLAPADGTVEQVEWGYGDGWGVSIVWTSADGGEKLHLGHLSRVVATGPVHAGQVMALTGHSGRCFPKGFAHVHIDRMIDGRVAPVVLGGVLIKPGRDPSHLRWYVSKGPAGSTTTADTRDRVRR